MNRIIIKLPLLFSLVFLFSCGNEKGNTGLEFAPNMYVSEPLDPLSQTADRVNKFNDNNMGMREPVENTVARGKMPYRFAKDDFKLAEDTLVNPIPLNELTLAEGKDLYNKFCNHCHGKTGAGDGLVGQKFKGVPKFNSTALKDKKAGHIFHVITMGKGRMRSHASQLNDEERWKIAHYVATLQKL